MMHSLCLPSFTSFLLLSYRATIECPCVVGASWSLFWFLRLGVSGSVFFCPPYHLCLNYLFHSSSFFPVCFEIFLVLLKDFSSSCPLWHGCLDHCSGLVNGDHLLLPPLHCQHHHCLLSVHNVWNVAQFHSVTQSCLTLCDPMDCSTPGFPVHHQLLELAQTHVHWVSDAI